jgi:hypothetical protein
MQRGASQAPGTADRPPAGLASFPFAALMSGQATAANTPTIALTPGSMPHALRWSCLSAALLLTSCASGVVLRGRVVEADEGSPVRNAEVRVWPSASPTETDSLGRFALKVPNGTRCIMLRAVMVGYGPSYRSLLIPRSSSSKITITIRPGWIPESRGLYVRECTPPDPVLAEWGMDTVMVNDSTGGSVGR